MDIDGDAEYTRAEYRYDALGRRTEKCVWRRHNNQPERTQYAWSGLQMVGETCGSHTDAAVQYIYTENSYEPLARVDSHGQHAEIYWYHTELNGLPESLTDSNGKQVWRGTSTAWGRSLRESTPASWDVPQNLRFQGQYLDRETDLHYNTFRYYDLTGGCYTQMDPIGLMGGLNLYSYVKDPQNWIDPLGLTTENIFIDYTNKTGLDEILKTEVINANKSGMVYITDLLMSPENVMRDILINNPMHAGRGDYALIFKVDTIQQNNIGLSSPLKFIHVGNLKLKDVIYSGKNPYSMISDLDYERD